MSFLKYANAQILEVKAAHSKHKVATLDKFADWSDHNYRTDDDYLYVRVRAISSRVNLNNDSWPSEELAKSYKTFIGKPLFVEHNNGDPRRTRGVIVDAKVHREEEKTASLDPYYSSDECWDCHKPPTWVELLLEVDAKTYPKFATAIIKGDIDGFSMGANVERSVCSHCGNEATSPEQFCRHIASKGAYFDYTDPNTGHKTSRRAAEHCFPPDAPILTADGTTKPIGEIRVGDKVIDHLGEARAVTEVMSHDVSEDLVAIHRRGQGFGRPLKATSNHPILAVRGSSWREIESDKTQVEFVEAGDIEVGDWVVEVSPTHETLVERIYPADWVPGAPTISSRFTVDDSRDRIEILPSGHPRTIRPCAACDSEMSLRPSELDRMFCSSLCYGTKRKGNLYYNPLKPLPDVIELDEDFGRWVGWYLAEGNVTFQKSGKAAGVQFSLHSGETKYRDELLRLGRKLFGLSGRVYRPSNGAKSMAVVFFSNSLGHLMSALGGNGFANKRLPTELMSAPIQFINGVTSAHEDGDGSFLPDGVRPNEHRHATSSDDLADQLYQMSIWLGRTPARHLTKATEQNKRTKPGHMICWSDGAGPSTVTRVRTGQWTFCQVSRIDHVPYEGPVHNLEVEDTHTYVAYGQAVHNCYDFHFFELSGVVTPADPTATTRPGTLKHATIEKESLGMPPAWFFDSLAAGYLPAVAAGSKVVDLWRDYQSKFGDQQVDPKELKNRVEQIAVIGGGETLPKFYDQDAPRGSATEHVVTHLVDKTAERNDPPQYEAETAPSKVDTLRQERMCPVCGTPGMDDGSCRVCQYVEAPEGFDNPDLEKAKEVDQQMREKSGPVEIQDEQDPSQMVPQQTTSSVSSDLKSEGHSNGPHLVTANTGGPRGRIRVEETPALPASRKSSDKPKDARVVEDHNKPVESSAQKGNDTNMSETQKTADGAEAHGGSDTAPDKRVDVEGVGAAIDGPLEGIEHQDVSKDVNVTGEPTSTWSGTDGQTDAVTNDAFPASEDSVKAAGAKEAGPKFPDHEPTRVDLHAEVSEEVGDRTQTFGDTRNQADPVTKEVGDLIDAHKAAARKHALACIRLAEAEIDLGLTPEDDKYNRVSELENASQDELDAQIATLARVRTAGLRKQVPAKKTAATKMPSLQGRRASVEPSEHAVPSSDQDISDAQAFM